MNSWMKFALLGSMVLASISISACELTDGYKSSRLEFYRKANSSYEECKSSISEYLYWRAYSKCVAEEKDNSVKGGCAHIASFQAADNLDKELTHCLVLKPKPEELSRMFDRLVEKQSIIKCSDNY